MREGSNAEEASESKAKELEEKKKKLKVAIAAGKVGKSLGSKLYGDGAQ